MEAQKDHWIINPVLDSDWLADSFFSKQSKEERKKNKRKGSSLGKARSSLDVLAVEYRRRQCAKRVIVAAAENRRHAAKSQKRKQYGVHLSPQP